MRILKINDNLNLSYKFSMYATTTSDRDKNSPKVSLFYKGGRTLYG